MNKIKYFCMKSFVTLAPKHVPGTKILRYLYTKQSNSKALNQPKNIKCTLTVFNKRGKYATSA